MRITALVVLLACVACQVYARAQDDEPRPAAPSRGLLKRGQLVKGKPTTTTTPAPQEEAEYEEEVEYADGEGQEPSTEAPPSSTEGKKLVGNGVRPFRSNTELLEALKRRRVQAAEAKLRGINTPATQSQEAPTEAPIKANNIKPNRVPAIIRNDSKTATNGVRRTKTPEKKQSTTQTNSKRQNTSQNRRKTADDDIETTTTSETNNVVKHNKYRKTTENVNGPVLYSRDKKRFNKEKETKEDSPVSLSKPSRNRFSRPSPRAVPESDPEEQSEPAPAPIRTGRTFRRN